MIELCFLDPPAKNFIYKNNYFLDKKNNRFRSAEIWVREHHNYNYSKVKNKIKKLDFISDDCYLAIVDARYKSNLIFCEKEFDVLFFRSLIKNYLEQCIEKGEFIERPLILKYPLVFRDSYSKGCWFSVELYRYFGPFICGCNFTNEFKNIKELLG